MSSKLLCSMAALLAALATPACGSHAPDPIARGSAAITWSITMNGRPASCAQAGAVSVSVILHPHAGPDVTSVLPCADAVGTTPSVPVGTYDATLTLRSATGATIASAPTQAAVRITTGHVVQLAPAAFDAPPHGMLVLSFSAIASSGNCRPRDQGGAGITDVFIDFEHAGDGCAPVTFTRARAGVAIGMYTVNCGKPAALRCIERDETLAIDGIDAGAYAIGIEAAVGPSPCWTSNDVLLVPGGATLVKPIQLAPRSAPGC